MELMQDFNGNVLHTNQKEISKKSKNLLKSLLISKFYSIDLHKQYWLYDDAKDIIKCAEEYGFKKLAKEFKKNI
jgi:hypothetical protein